MKQVTSATLRAVLDEFGGISMTDEELKKVTPVVAAFIAEFSRLDELDLANIDSALQMHADDGGFSID